MSGQREEEVLSLSAKLAALGMEEVLAALDKEDDAVTGAVTEYILLYANRLADCLQRGEDYLSLLTPSTQTSAVEAAAMALVLESAEEELDAC